MRINLNRANPARLASKLSNTIRGTGESKREAKQNSEIVGRNGQARSDKLHSKSEITNFRSTASQYFQYLKDNGGIKGNVTTETATAFINEKIEKGEWKGSTANTNIHHMQSIAIAFEKNGLKADINTKEIADNLKDIGHDLSKTHENRAYNNPQAVVNNMQSSQHYISAVLQHEAGLRVDDATNSEKWTINNDNTLTISGSKGGITYTTAPLSQEVVQMVREAKENDYRANIDSYRNDLKEAVEKSGETWQSTHGLRYNFAQERLEQLKQETDTKEALEQVSLELGHSRAEITLHYLGV